MCIRDRCCAQASRRALAALLARSLRAAFDRHADGLLVPLGTHAVLDDRRDDPDEDRPAFRLCCHSARGAHRPVAAVAVRPLPERRVCRSTVGSSDRRADVPLWRKAARQNFPQAKAIKKPRTPFQNGVRGLYILGIYTFFAARNKFGGAGKRFSRSSTANPASATDRSSERIVSNAT